MSLSFIKPQTKHIFANITKIWWFYIALTAVILVGYYMFLQIESANSLRRVAEYRALQSKIQLQTKYLNEYFERTVYEATLTNKRLDTHNIRKEKLRDLLEIIPDKITINFIEFSNYSLTLKGVTPSKEFFYFGLQALLKASFGKSSVNFYALPNGWYQFISLSYIEQELSQSQKSDEK
ncbi:hypothetical protein [Helicobacter fennelliae]|uniref:hypothetical protein n=1 Tax=Helicobacter fennelliae TaxID=215 RepID=UPI000E03E75C|nr:hypothetical protein [Helicobacter fennelliae]STQ83641.1 membrane protein [Helicobacter fennelliae]